MMSSLHSGIRRRPRRSGAALIIVLALLVLITALMAIFLSRALIERKVSASSASGNSASILARSAVDMITGDLRQEIVNGSTATNVGPSTYVTTLYFPLSATNMVPQRAGLATNSAGVDFAPNLVRRSYRFDTNALFVPSRASAVNSSTDASLNGRSIALSRWNSHYLIPRANAGSTTIDSTPTNYFTAPDWVMVTTNGPTVMATPNPATIGRYAYAVYDEGGLLDANVAGYPSGMSTYLASQLAGKGSLALADLTAIGLTTTDIDNLVGWRNYATVQPSSGSFGSYNFAGDNNATTNYYNYVSTTTNGFLTVNPQQYSSRTDQAFSSRQALLKYQRSANFSQDALQYLGTFTRDLEQPSFRPDPNRPKNTGHLLKNPLEGSAGVPLGYGGNDSYYATYPAALSSATGHQDDINPFLLSVRDATGLPVLKRRFPLSRLAYVVANPPTANATLIKLYFGLVWDSTNCRWTYTSPDAATAQTSIKTLAQVAAVTPVREPDFFETLKAAINCDSLGKQMGSTDGYSSETWFTENEAAIDGRIDYQVWQIGANIIDQYDSDSYPTRIYVADKPALSAGTGGTPANPYDNTLHFTAGNKSDYPREIYGTEDVPYMLGYQENWYRTGTLTTSDIDPNYTPPGGSQVNAGTPSFSGHSLYEVSGLIQPVLWNPHTPGTNPHYSGDANYPASFQVVAGDIRKNTVADTVTSTARDTWWYTNAATAVSTYPASGGTTPTSYAQASIGPINVSTGVSPTYIQFQTSASGSANFREPYRLHAPADPAGSSTTAYSGGIISSFDLEETAFTQALGFFTGKAWCGPVWYDNPASPTAATRHGYLDITDIDTSLRIHLQYKNPYAATPAYLTYDTINFAYLGSSAGLCLSGADDSSIKIRSMGAGFRCDPRTNRWGLGTSQVCPFWDSRFTKWDGVSAKPSWLSTYPFTAICYFPQLKTLATGQSTDAVIKTQPHNDIKMWAPGWQHVNSNGLVVPGDSQLNSQTAVTGASVYQPGQKTYYADPDGVVRRASGTYYDSSSGNGLSCVTGNNNSRPVILNRPFRSIAELGYTFRGQAWEDIDFFNPESGDSALLDAFCLNELQNAPGDVTVAGRVDLNTRQPLVLQSLIQGVSKAEGGTITTTEATAAAQALVNWTTANPSISTNMTAGIFNKGPLRNRSELTGKFVSAVSFTPAGSYEQNPTQNYYDGSTSYSGYSSMLTSPGVFSATDAADSQIKRRRECVMRALADSGNARTWNLLIDVIAQTGRYAPGSTDLTKFIVSGESRYWVHVAVDRYTGAIIAESFEPVSD